MRVSVIISFNICLHSDKTQHLGVINCRNCRISSKGIPYRIKRVMLLKSAHVQGQSLQARAAAAKFVQRELTTLNQPTWPSVVLWYEAGVIAPRFEVRVGDAAAHVGHVGGHTTHHKPAAVQSKTGLTACPSLLSVCSSWLSGFDFVGS